MYKYVTSERMYNKLVKIVKNSSLPIVDVSLKLINPFKYILLSTPTITFTKLARKCFTVHSFNFSYFNYE